MNAEITTDFTIIPGREFGLPCNLKCGPGVRPFGTIHFENRRNRTDEYDSSNELCISLKRKSKLLASREECIFTNDEIEVLYHFVWLHFDVIQTYLKGYTTSKGFLRDLHKFNGKPVQDEAINWKRLVFVQYGIILYVRYWPKDFVVEYKSKFGILRYRSSHIPAAFPKIYTEESIVAECLKLWPDFIKAENYIADHQDVIDCELAKLHRNIEFYKDQFNTGFCKESVQNHIQIWVDHNTDDHIRGIIEDYIKELCEKMEKENEPFNSSSANSIP